MSYCLVISHQAKSEDDVKSEKEWLETEKVWLLHRGGFSEVFLLKSESTALAEGRVRVKLESGDIIEVDEDDIEKVSIEAQSDINICNPNKFHKTDDVASLNPNLHPLIA